MLGEIWKIGDWSVFPAENTLRRDGSEVKVPPRLMDALIFFARHPDHVISRTELVAHLWNRSVVTCKSSKDHSKPRNEVDTSLKSPV